MARWRYLLIGVGFVAVVGLQMGFFAIETGDPLYRLRISATHDAVDRAGIAVTGALDREGVLNAGLLAGPVLALFVSQKFGLLFYLAIPAAIVAIRSRWLDARARSVLGWTAAGAVVSFLFVALNVGILYVVPRYFMVTAAMAAVPVAVMAAHWWVVRPRLAVLGAAAFAASCLGLLYLENTNPMFAEQQATAFIAGQPDRVFMEPVTARRMRILLLERGLESRLSSAAPPPGALVAVKAGVIEACLRDAACTHKAAMQAYMPGPGWSEVARNEPPRRWLGTLLRAMGAARVVPPDIFKKIEQPNVTLTVYRTPSGS